MLKLLDYNNWSSVQWLLAIRISPYGEASLYVMYQQLKIILIFSDNSLGSVYRVSLGPYFGNFQCILGKIIMHLMKSTIIWGTTPYRLVEIYFLLLRDYTALTCQKIAVFIVTSVRTSSLTVCSVLTFCILLCC
jgi:hypothetical protein